jgi:Uma2 family endonuclease
MAIIIEPPEVPLLPDVELLETDGEPLESDWHRLEINLLIEVVKLHERDQTDYYVGGNMFIYFSEEQARNHDFRGPDFFFVRRVKSEPLRKYWAVWLEGGRYPDAIIELLSSSTAVLDRTVKKDVYEKTFRTPSYFCYDPATKQLQGWRLVSGKYEPLTCNERGWLWCEELGLWLGTWEGKFQGNHATWLRFYDAAGNVVPTFAEAAEQRATEESQRTEAERQRAEAERQRAEAERQRAEAAEAELARLRSQLGQQGNGPAESGNSQ